MAFCFQQNDRRLRLVKKAMKDFFDKLKNGTDISQCRFH